MRGVRIASVGAVVGADVEAIRRDPGDNHGFYVSLESGMVANFDARTLPSNLDQPSPARFTIAAHDGAACALDMNANIRGCITTAGTDKMVKIWNVQEHEDGTKRSALSQAVISDCLQGESSRLSGLQTTL
ncbi:hypothetical protein EDB84DRAFT_1557597 [Lactarius hengduanensis]|nr:hypothetical protein EDB84DRAFT_1557597 [Lactarius hengduanensis]